MEPRIISGLSCHLRGQQSMTLSRTQTGFVALVLAQRVFPVRPFSAAKPQTTSPKRGLQTGWGWGFHKERHPDHARPTFSHSSGTCILPQEVMPTEGLAIPCAIQARESPGCMVILGKTDRILHYSTWMWFPTSGLVQEAVVF